MNDFPRLRRVQVVSTGPDRLPLAKLQARGIRVYHADDTYAIQMNEAISLDRLWTAGFFVRDNSLKNYTRLISFRIYPKF